MNSIPEDKDAVEDNTIINDIRSPANFKSITFSKFKKTDARNQFIQNMIKNKVEPACYWCAELVCAGHFMEVWEIILHYMGKHIHLGNPKLVIYLETRYQLFRETMTTGFYSNELGYRNNDKVRKLFAEIVCVLSLSTRKHSFEPIKINRAEEFDMTQMPERLKAPNMSFAEPVFQKDDPKELYIAINEFGYHVSSETPNTMSACYWVEWVLEFGQVCKTKKTPCFCERRAFATVENKLQKDIIWLIWDSILQVAKKREPFILKLIQSLLTLFCIKYTTAVAKKRRYLLYFAVALLIDPVPTGVEIVAAANKPVLQSVISNINKVYKQIQKNQESPNTEYLFNNLDSHNSVERSMRQMEMVNSMDRSMFGGGGDQR